MKDLKLVQKLTRRAKSVKRAASAYDTVNKVDKRASTLAASPSAWSLAFKAQRKMDSKLGNDMIAQEPAISVVINATTLERFDFGVSDFGMLLTVPAGLISSSKIRPTRIVEIREGELKGMQLSVVALISATEVRLADVATYTGPESNVSCRVELSTVKASWN